MQLSSNKLLLPLVVLSTLVISGCASQQQGTNGTQQATSNEELNQYLKTGTAGATVLTNSPWGANVQVIADQPYFAASGRTCRQLQVTPANGATTQHIACQNKTGNWAITRDLKQL